MQSLAGSLGIVFFIVYMGLILGLTIYFFVLMHSMAKSLKRIADKVDKIDKIIDKKEELSGK